MKLYSCNYDRDLPYAILLHRMQFVFHRSHLLNCIRLEYFKLVVMLHDFGIIIQNEIIRSADPNK